MPQVAGRRRVVGGVMGLSTSGLAFCQYGVVERAYAMLLWAHPMLRRDISDWRGS